MTMDSTKSSNALTGSAKIAVLVLMGLPGSGKTTLCFSLPQFLGCKYHIIHICYDQVIPFKNMESWEQTRGSWKDERAKIVQATETLLCNLICFSGPRIEKCGYEKETFQDKHQLPPNIHHSLYDKSIISENACNDALCRNKNTTDCIDSLRKGEIHSNQNVDSSFRLECLVGGNRGHYTMLNSFSDIVSMCDKLSECDFQNELFVVCVDDNCYYRSMRKEWWNLAAKYELPFCTVTLKCEVEVCIRRVRERLHSSAFHSPNVPENVIGRMDKHLEFPNGDLFPWEKHSIVIDSNSFNITVDTKPNPCLLSDERPAVDKFSLESLNSIKKLINTSLLEPAKFMIKEKHSDSSSVTTSVIHLADLALRKIVSNSDPTIRAKVNIKRKNILEDLRNSKLTIPSDILGELKDSFEQKLYDYMDTLINLHY